MDVDLMLQEDKKSSVEDLAAKIEKLVKVLTLVVMNFFEIT